jgi:hypothetical protein
MLHGQQNIKLWNSASDVYQPITLFQHWFGINITISELVVTSKYPTFLWGCTTLD